MTYDPGDCADLTPEDPGLAPALQRERERAQQRMEKPEVESWMLGQYISFPPARGTW